MNAFAQKTYAQAIEQLADTWGDREALIYGDVRYSFSDIKAETDRASRKLISLGLAKGDKVAIWLPNRVELLFVWLGAAQIGLTAVILNTRLRLEEVAYQIGQSDSIALVVPGDGAFRDFLDDAATICPDIRTGAPGTVIGGDACPELKFVIPLDDTAHGFSSLTKWDELDDSDETPLPYETDMNSPGLIVYSSGTTALPKGAMIGHAIWRKAADHGARFYQTKDDRLYLCVPLFSILSTVNGVITFWVGGSSVVLADRFEPEAMLSAIEREKCTAAYLLPLMIQKAIALPNFDDFDLSALRTGILVTTDADAYQTAFDKLGMNEVITSYGMTETSSACTRTWADDPLEVRINTHGKPLPDINVRVADPETNRELPVGETGEIQVSGYNVMLGYYKKPEETARAFTEDGWYKTGDAGLKLEDGAFKFLRRLSEGYKHKGFNVSAAEVEAALHKHPHVNRAAVFGIPDKTFGEIGIAYVIPEAGSAPDPQSILAFLRDHLASFKLPAHIFFSEEFPLTAGTEKVQKFKLRERALESLAGEAGA